MAQITLGKAWGTAHHLYLWLCCKALPQGDLASILGEGLGPTSALGYKDLRSPEGIVKDPGGHPPGHL